VSFCILIVEDEMLLALDLEHMLRDAGYDVCGVATDAEEAVTVAEKCLPDLALMDVRLAHESSGIDAARRLRRGWNVPSIFISANLDQDTRAHAMEAAPLGFVDKPYRQHDILSAVASAEARLSA
jgi:CheY-like chemotaxis protein